MVGVYYKVRSVQWYIGVYYHEPVLIQKVVNVHVDLNTVPHIHIHVHVVRHSLPPLAAHIGAFLKANVSNYMYMYMALCAVVCVCVCSTLTDLPEQ